MDKIASHPNSRRDSGRLLQLKNEKIGRMTALALLIALIVVLQSLGGMIPPVGGFTISLVLIPIVLGAALYGPGVGALLGAAFGVLVIIGCVNGTDVGGQMVFQANPFLCIFVVMLKGIFAGLASGFIYEWLAPKNRTLAMMLAAVVCPVVNTGFFVACMWVFFIDVLAAWAGGGDILGYVLTGLVLCNFVPELLINVVFSFAGQRIVSVVKK